MDSQPRRDLPVPLRVGQRRRQGTSNAGRGVNVTIAGWRR
jgi:hypothetical protein